MGGFSFTRADVTATYEAIFALEIAIEDIREWERAGSSYDVHTGTVHFSGDADSLIEILERAKTDLRLLRATPEAVALQGIALGVERVVDGQRYSSALRATADRAPRLLFHVSAREIEFLRKRHLEEFAKDVGDEARFVAYADPRLASAVEKYANFVRRQRAGATSPEDRTEDIIAEKAKLMLMAEPEPDRTAFTHQDPPPLPIQPDQVKLIGTFTNTSIDAIKSQKDIDEMVAQMFKDPDVVWYLFKEETQSNEFVRRAFEGGIIQLTESVRHYFRLPGKDNFVQIHPRLAKNDWERDLISRGPSYTRLRISLGAGVKRELELKYRIELESRIRARAPVSLQSGGSVAAPAAESGTSLAPGGTHMAPPLPTPEAEQKARAAHPASSMSQEEKDAMAMGLAAQGKSFVKIAEALGVNRQDFYLSTDKGGGPNREKWPQLWAGKGMLEKNKLERQERTPASARDSKTASELAAVTPDRCPDCGRFRNLDETTCFCGRPWPARG